MSWSQGKVQDNEMSGYRVTELFYGKGVDKYQQLRMYHYQKHCLLLFLRFKQ